MLIGYDTEYGLKRTTLVSGEVRGDVSTVEPVCACLVFEDGREWRISDGWSRLQEVFDDPHYTFVVHGCHAEALFCARVGLSFPKKFYDTQLMGLLVLHALTFHLAGGVYKSARLSDLAIRYAVPLPWADEKERVRESIMQGTYLVDYGLERVFDYCSGDARCCLQLFGPLRADLIGRCGLHAEKHLLELYQPYALIMAQAARKGLRFDLQAWDRLLTFSPRYRAQLLGVMGEFGYRHDGRGIGDRAFERMIRTIGMERTWPRTPGGLLSTKSDDLKALRHQHVAIDAVHRLTKFDNFMAQDLGGRVDRDGRLRCRILPLAQHTGRNSTSSPNLMGIPGEMRPLILPDEGCKFVHFDFSQHEPGVAAFLSDDQALLQDFANGDVYANLGLRMGLIRPEMSESERRSIRNGLLKPLMLAIIYCKSAASIARDVPCSYHDASIYLRNFRDTYAGLFSWLRSYVAVGMERGWAENRIGFRAAFDVVDVNQRSHIARSCQNFPIQSSAAACFLLTGTYLAEAGADIRLPLHDAYLVNVRADPVSIRESQVKIDMATRTAIKQLFPGLSVKREIEVLDRFAKDGRQNSFETWISALEGTLCGKK